MTRAAFFDLDRTLVRVNTGRAYMKWRYRRREIGRVQLLRGTWWTLRYVLGMLEVEEVSRRVASSLRGLEEARMAAECEAWVHEEIRPHITDAARREVERCRDRGEVCAVLSASWPYITGPIAAELGIEHVLCTRLDVIDGRFTGAIADPLCYGRGKVIWARRWAEEHGLRVEESSFYTDSVSDLPMLEQVREPRVINPDPRLRAIAWRRRWKVEEWV